MHCFGFRRGFEEFSDLCNPSSSAFLANAKYIRLAWDSPAKAALRFSSVLIIKFTKNSK